MSTFLLSQPSLQFYFPTEPQFLSLWSNKGLCFVHESMQQKTEGRHKKCRLLTTPAPPPPLSGAAVAMPWPRRWASRPAGFFLLLSISGPCHRRYRAKLLSKVIYPKYTKHWPYTVANCDCVCNKMFNQGLNHGLFLSLFKFISCAIHRTV